MPRFLIVNTYYPEVIRKVYQQQPDLENRPYLEQLNALLDVGFARANFMQKHLQSLGYEAQDIIINAVQLQETWAKENNSQLISSAMPDDWRRTIGLGLNKLSRRHIMGWVSDRLQQIALEQIKVFKPDFVLNENLIAFSPQYIREIKKLCRVLIGECNYPIPKLDLKPYDLMLTAHPAMAEGFKKVGMSSIYWPHAFEASILSKIENIEKTTAQSVTFAGSVIGSRFFLYHDRWRMISALHKQLPIEVWGKVHEPPRGLKVHPSVWGYEMHRVLALGHISLNVHTDRYTNHTTGATYVGYATNMRLFESTGVGSCLLTDWKPNLKDLFEVDTEVVTYKSIDECVEKAKWLINHPLECKQIALAGQQRTLKDHTLEQRVYILSEAIQQLKLPLA